MRKHLLALLTVLFLGYFNQSMYAQNSWTTFVWEDLNGDGTQDPGEPGITGIPSAEMLLFQDVNGNGIDGPDVSFPYSTDNGDGTYTWAGTLPDGDYYLQFLYHDSGSGTQYFLSPFQNGSGPALDSDIDPFLNSTTVAVVLSGATNEEDTDVGLFLGATIGDFVWHDLNGDGIQDGGEPGIDGVTVSLIDEFGAPVNDANGNPVTPILTAGGGQYEFDELEPGNYRVEFTTPPGTGTNGMNWYATTVTINVDPGDFTNDSDADPNDMLRSHVIVLESDETDDKIDAGFIVGSSIGNLVWEDQNGNGIQDGGEPGLDNVEVRLLDDAGNPVATYADGTPVPNPLLTAGGGQYEFMPVSPGDYIVEFSLPTEGGFDWRATTVDVNGLNTDANDEDIDSDADPANNLRSHVITVESDDPEEIRIDAGFFATADIGDFAFCDENGNGIQDPGEPGLRNVRVRLLDPNNGFAVVNDPDGNPIDVAVNPDGTYLLDLVPPGDFVVEFYDLPPGYEWTRQDASGDDNTDSDVDQATGRTGIINVVSRDIDEENIHDAGAYQLITLTGILWAEDDGNSIFDGENGVGGVTVELYDISGNLVETAITGAGIYTFEDLAPGQYNIIIPQFNFDMGGALSGFNSCEIDGGSPDDMVDNDDNGPGAGSGQIETGLFQLLSNCEDIGVEITYVDFCFTFDCGMENSLANPICSEITEADYICDLNNLALFCSRMPENNSGGSQPAPLCPGGGAPHNMSWFAFVAGEGNYEIEVVPFNCVGSTTGQEGVQIGIYTDCTFTESIFCNPNCSTNPVSVSSDDLEPGEVYFFFIDGCSSSVCSYEVNINGNYSPTTLDPTDMCLLDNGAPLCQDETYCPGADVVFEVQGLDAEVDYFWSINVISGNYNGDLNPMTMENTLTLTFDEEGVFEVCFVTADNGCTNSTNPAPFCRTVTIEDLEDEMFDEQFLCQEDLATFSFDVFDPDDPNADGTFGWQVTGATPDFGLVQGTVVTPEGCEYEQEFMLTQNPPGGTGDTVVTVCPDQFPISLDGGNIVVDQNSFGGNTVLQLDNIALVNSESAFGCDTSVNIIFEQLIIQNTLFLDQICLPEGILIDFEFDPSLTTMNGLITYNWTHSNGSTLTQNFNGDETTIIVPQSEGSGMITLEVTIEKNGVTCTQSFMTDVDFEAFFPSLPTIDGALSLCESDGVVTYTATSSADVFDFMWTVPNGVQSTISGDDNEMIEINWSGTTGGTISVVAINACGESEEQQVNVEIIPQAVPTYDVTAEICSGEIAVIEFTGNAADVDDFNWDFSGGVIDNGTGGEGPGPHEVIFTDEGFQLITLQTIDAFGCESVITVDSVNVLSPPQPPTVTCVPSTNGIVFTWNEDVPGGIDYTVNVLNGATGTQSAGMYDVSGLTAGDVVEIEVVVTLDNVCDSVVSISSSCVVQNCVPPNLSLDSPQDSICLYDDADPFTLTTAVDPVTDGAGVFSGPGIVDAAAGVFDPDSANIGVNNITYNYTTDDGCISSPVTIPITVFAVPEADFMPALDTICINEDVQLSFTGTGNPTDYIWDYGADGTAGAGGPTPTVTYTTPGLKTITLSVERNGCISDEVTGTVLVQDLLTPISVTCTAQGLDFVTFGWNDVDGATEYEVTVTTPTGTTTFTTTDLAYTASGLLPGDVVDITVVVITDSRCPGSSDGSTCEARLCPDFTFDFNSNIPLDICVDNNSTTVDLSYSVGNAQGTGMGTWTGLGVTGDVFDPVGLPEGDYDLMLEYVEEGCQDDTLVTITLIGQPTSDFTLDNDVVCVTETVVLSYAGLGYPNETFNPTFPAGVNATDLGGGNYELTFDNPGMYDVSLQVENNGCTSGVTTDMIEAQEELVFGDIDCDESLDQIVFTWNAVDCSSQYEILVNGSIVPESPITGTTYTVSGLTEGEMIDIEIVAVSDCACPDVSQVQSCTASACPPVDITLDAPALDFCLGDNPEAVAISTAFDGSDGSGTISWSGPGVDVNGFFNPINAGAGTHVVTMAYAEGNCDDYGSTITFNVYESPDAGVQFSQPDCYLNDSTLVDFVVTGGDGNYTYILEGDTLTASDALLTPGGYTLMVVDGNLCSAMSNFTINNPVQPFPVIEGDTLLTEGDFGIYSINPGIFAGLAIDSIVWFANGVEICNESDCFEISDAPPVGGTAYQVTVFYNDGCEVSAFYNVTVEEEEPVTVVTIPNIFSPNGDGANDDFYIYTNDPEVVINSFRIYDRWGNQVFNNETPYTPFDTQITWDGTMNGSVVQPGVYVYVLELVEDGRTKVRSGDITILR